MHIQEERSSREETGISGKGKERSSIEESETNPSNKNINKRSMMSPTKVSPLNDDMLTEVLSYLPLDAATRFKSVSKSWLRLISDPYFESLRTQRSTAAVLGFFQQGDIYGTGLIHASLYRPVDNSRRLKIQLLDGLHYYILAACNGLLFGIRYADRSYFVWNLQMESLKEIPPPPSPYWTPSYGVVSRVSCSNCYDIVAIDSYYAADNRAPSGYVYSSTTCVWTPFGRRAITDNVVTENLNIRSYLNLVGPASARGSLHWLTDDGRICALDLRKQRLKWMGLPNQAIISKLGGPYLNIWFGSVGNDLYVVLVSGRDTELWILENYEECRWGKVLEVKGSDSKAGAPVFFDGRRIAIAVPREWVAAKAKWIDLYDTHSKKWEKPRFLDSYVGSSLSFVPLVEDKF